MSSIASSIDPNIQQAVMNDRDRMDPPQSQKPIVPIRKLRKNKVNILEFMGVVDGPLDMSSNSVFSNESLNLGPKVNDTPLSDGECHEIVTGSDSGLDDDKNNEMSDDIPSTESDYGDTSSDEELSGCYDVMGHANDTESSIQLIKCVAIREDFDIPEVVVSLDEETPGNYEDESDSDCADFQHVFEITAEEINAEDNVTEVNDSVNFVSVAEVEVDESTDDSEQDEHTVTSYDLNNNAEGDQISFQKDDEDGHDESCQISVITKVPVQANVEQLEKLDTSNEKSTKEIVIEVEVEDGQSFPERSSLKVIPNCTEPQEEISIEDGNKCSPAMPIGELSMVYKNEPSVESAPLLISKCVKFQEVLMEDKNESLHTKEDDRDEYFTEDNTEPSLECSSEMVVQCAKFQENKSDEASVKEDAEENCHPKYMEDVPSAENIPYIVDFEEESKVEDSNDGDELCSEHPTTEYMAKRSIVEVKIEPIEGQNEEKVVEHNNKDVSVKKDDNLCLKDFEMSIKDIELERRRIIGNQAVRRKTIQSWINGQEYIVDEDDLLHSSDKEQQEVEYNVVDDDDFNEDEQKEKKENSSVAEKDFVIDVVQIDELDTIIKTEQSVEEITQNADISSISSNGEVDSQSIIEKKERTKSYWESMMMPKCNALELPICQNIEEDLKYKDGVHNSDNDEKCEVELCDFQELDLEAPRIVAEPKIPIRHVPVVIHKKTKLTPIVPVCVDSMSPTFAGNIVEQEIEMQKKREEEFRKESTRIRSPVCEDISGGATITHQTQTNKPQVVGEVYRTKSPVSSSLTNEFTAELVVLAPPTHYRDGSDSGTFDTDTDPNTNLESKFLDDSDRDFTSPDSDKKGYDQEVSSDLGEELQCTSPIINIAGSYESLNSVGTSGGSSVDYSPRKRGRVASVRPLNSEDEQETVRVKYSFLSETPIEREIRMNKEREEEMKIENNIRSMSLMKSNRIVDNKNKINASMIPGDCKVSGEKTFATSRIQQEIEEQQNREMEYKSKTKSKFEHVVDSKNIEIVKSAVLVECSRQKTAKMEEVRQTRSFSIGHVNNNYQMGRVEPNIQNHNQFNISARKNSLPLIGSNRPVVSMHKFISSGGKTGVKGPFAPKVMNKSQSNDTTAHRTTVYEPTAIIKKQNLNEQRSVVRKSYCSAETKIQQELRQMKEREDELKRQRSRLHGSSQPNLTVLNYSNGTTDEPKSSSTNRVKEAEDTPPPPPPPPTLISLEQRCLSNPNLLDFNDNDDSKNQQRGIAPPPKGTRRRSILIDQWENKIQCTK